MPTTSAACSMQFARFFSRRRVRQRTHGDEDAKRPWMPRRQDGSARERVVRRLNRRKSSEYLPRGAAPRRGRKAISNEQVAAPATSKVRRSPSNKDRIAPGNSNAIEPSNKERIGASNAQRIGPSHTDRIGASNGYSIEASRQMQPGTVTGSGQGASNARRTRNRTIKEESKQEDDSNQRSRKCCSKNEENTQDKVEYPRLFALHSCSCSRFL